MAFPRLSAPGSEIELLQRAGRLAGRTLAQIAAESGVALPADPARTKGWVGELIEACLGADAGPLPEPDFRGLGIELKTLPLGARGTPAESTYVCTVPLVDQFGNWERSNVRRKLARVLWVPIESGAGVPLAIRRVGSAWLWSPSPPEDEALRTDWEELTELLARGGIEHLSARYGRYLQVRPKAADASVLTRSADAHGGVARTNPRGFYLRAAFTKKLLAERADGRARG